MTKKKESYYLITLHPWFLSLYEEVQERSKAPLLPLPLLQREESEGINCQTTLKRQPSNKILVAFDGELYP
jgi:hypothetical protein